MFLDLDEDAKALAPNSCKDHFKMYELVDIMRQKDDLKFAQLLNRLHNRYECRFSLDGITTLHTTMTITNRLKITLTPLRLHSASSVRIPNSINNFRTLIPALRLRPLNLLSASTVNLHGLANTSIFHNNLRVMLSPLKSPVLR